MNGADVDLYSVQYDVDSDVDDDLCVSLL